MVGREKDEVKRERKMNLLKNEVGASHKFFKIQKFGHVLKISIFS